MGKCVGWVKQGLGYVPWVGWQFVRLVPRSEGTGDVVIASGFL